MISYDNGADEKIINTSNIYDGQLQINTSGIDYKISDIDDPGAFQVVTVKKQNPQHNAQVLMFLKSLGWNIGKEYLLLCVDDTGVIQPNVIDNTDKYYTPQCTLSMDNIINTDDIEYYTNHLSITNNHYLKQNIYSYWISSSHNTYLPYDQVFGSANECYYKLVLNIYFGGCIEIDTDAISEDNNDVVITHLSTNKNSILLRGILKIVIKSLKKKEKENIISGPIILTFDNKKLNKRWQHNIFWKVIEEELLTAENYKYVAVITDNYNLRNLPIYDEIDHDTNMSNQILLRWAENDCKEKFKEHCNHKDRCRENDENCKQMCMSNIDELNKINVGKELCQPSNPFTYTYIKNTDHWLHLLKGHHDFADNIILVDNETKSVTVNRNLKYYKGNHNLIVNLQRNIMRIFPHLTYIMSQNYNNMTFFRDGVQITALNLQYISNPWYLNRAVFMPQTGVPCSPFDTNNDDLPDCKNGWKYAIKTQSQTPLAYRLKPLWLLGIIPNPGLYRLTIIIKKCSKIQNGNIVEDVSSDYKKVNLTYGLTDDKKKDKSLDTGIVFDEIDVTVPFFVLQIIKPPQFITESKYTSGIEIPWSMKQLSGKLTVDVYKINKTMIGSLNKVELNDNCETSTLFNTNKQLRIELEYKWAFKSGIKEMYEYNKAIIQLRTNDVYKNKTVKNFLEDLTLLNGFQDELAKKLADACKDESKTECRCDNCQQFEDETKEAEKYTYNISQAITGAEPIDTSKIKDD